MESNGVVLKDDDKLFDLGFNDGYERAIKILKKNPENVDFIKIVKVPTYFEGYIAGVEEAKKEFEDTPKQR